ncbi:MAG: hypothetical protein ACLS9I_05525 [Adlercreutzia equolifaciens]
MPRSTAHLVPVQAGGACVASWRCHHRLGQSPQFVLMGLCLSVALLAIAMLQDHHQRKR